VHNAAHGAENIGARRYRPEHQRAAYENSYRYNSYEMAFETHWLPRLSENPSVAAWKKTRRSGTYLVSGLI